MKLTVEVDEHFIKRAVYEREGKKWLSLSWLPRWVELEIIEEEPQRRRGRPRKEQNDDGVE